MRIVRKYKLVWFWHPFFWEARDQLLACYRPGWPFLKWVTGFEYRLSNLDMAALQQMPTPPIPKSLQMPTEADGDINCDVWAWDGSEWLLVHWYSVVCCSRFVFWLPTDLKPPQYDMNGNDHGWFASDDEAALVIPEGGVGNG